MKMNGFEENQPLTVEAVENHIYFYSAVTTDRCLALVRLLLETDIHLQTEKATRKAEGITPIWLHIQSFGGDPFAAFSVADQIATVTTPVYSIVEGCAASAATIISTACRHRYIQPNAFMMIHQISTFFEGTHEELKDELALVEMLSSNLKHWYLTHSATSEIVLEEKLKRDFWMNAQQAKEFGFVDEICGNIFA